MAMPVSPVPPSNKSIPFTLGDSLGVLGVMLALIGFVLNFPVILRIALLVIAISLFAVLARRSHWTHEWPTWAQVVAAAVFAIAVLGIGIPQLITQWKEEHRPLPDKATAQVASTGRSTSEPPNQTPTPTPPTSAKPLKRAKRSKPTVSDVSITSTPTTSQSCPNGICIGGNNSGNPTVNNTYSGLQLPPQRMLSLSDFEALRDGLKQSAGSVRFIYMREEETDRFVKQLACAFMQSGRWRISSDPIGFARLNPGITLIDDPSSAFNTAKAALESAHIEFTIGSLGTGAYSGPSTWGHVDVAVDIGSQGLTTASATVNPNTAHDLANLLKSLGCPN